MTHTYLDLARKNNGDAEDGTVSHDLLQPRVAPFTLDTRRKIARELRGSLCGFLEDGATTVRLYTKSRSG